MMLHRYSQNSALPLHSDPANKYMPWIIALVVFLATIMLITTSTVRTISQGWQTEFTHKLSIEVPAVQKDKTAQDKMVDAVYRYLSNLKEVEKVERVEEEKIKKLLLPWLGADAFTQDLPLPRVVEVDFDPNVDVDLVLLEEKLAQIVPGIKLEDHGQWRKRVNQTVQTVEIVTFAIAILVFAVALILSGFMTCTGLLIHKDIVKLLNLIGATSGYIAGIFQQNMLILGIKGAIRGIILSLITFAVFFVFFNISHLMVSVSSIFFLKILILILSIPTIVTVSMIVISRLTVRRTLNRLG